jgi:hypothetical protein
MTVIHKGDDTGAFDQNFIRIDINNPTGEKITKVILQCGPIQKVYTNPKFPIYVNFDHNESNRLPQDSVCYLQVFDAKGRRQTCEGTLEFTAKQKVVADERIRRG